MLYAAGRWRSTGWELQRAAGLRRDLLHLSQRQRLDLQRQRMSEQRVPGPGSLSGGARRRSGPMQGADAEAVTARGRRFGTDTRTAAEATTSANRAHRRRMEDHGPKLPTPSPARTRAFGGAPKCRVRTPVFLDSLPPLTSALLGSPCLPSVYQGRTDFSRHPFFSIQPIGRSPRVILAAANSKTWRQARGPTGLSPGDGPDDGGGVRSGCCLGCTFHTIGALCETCAGPSCWRILRFAAA